MFTTATSAANTGENCGDAIWDFITARAKRPLPLIMFSVKSSGRMFLMLDAFTLFTRPLIDFFNASHVIRWYSGPVLSVCSAIICASLKGGI